MSSRSTQHSDVLIVGGGVIGVACAYYLAGGGLSVRIIERETMGAGASHGNCGLIFPSDLLPLCAPGAVATELKRTLLGTSPLYIKPRLDPGLALWLLRFAANCAPHLLARAVRAKDALMRLSDELFTDLWATEELACDAEHNGVLMAFRDPAALAAYEKTNRLLAPFGRAATFFDREAVRRLEPALSDGVCGGWHHPAESHLRPDRLMDAWTRVVRDRQVMINEGCRLTQIRRRNRRVVAVDTDAGPLTADRIVLAAGAWTAALARQMGIRIPVVPGKGYSITMTRPALCPSMPCYLYEPNVVVTPWQSGYRIGGTMEFSGFDQELDTRRLKKLETAAAKYLRQPMGPQVTERWTGLRPMCSDDLPIIGRAPAVDNLYLATGHGMLGVSTATGTGRLIADMILDRQPSIPPAPYAVDRFRIGG